MIVQHARPIVQGLVLATLAVVVHNDMTVSAQSTIETAASESSSREQRTALWNGWVDIWNGNFTNVDAVVSPGFRVHVALLDGSPDASIEGPAGLSRWIAQTRVFFPDLTFTTEVGPIIDGDHMAGHWSVTGTYAGGFPGATAPVGTVVEFHGTDVLRIEGGQVAEYWLVSDIATLMMQLGVVAT